MTKGNIIIALIKQALIWLLAAISILAVSSAIYIIIPHPLNGKNFSPIEAPILIAHAGGGHHFGKHSNSKEAMDQAVANGFKYIELDFRLAKNGEWVLMRNWTHSHLRYFSRFPRLPEVFLDQLKITPNSAESFRNRNMRYNLTPMTLTDATLWLGENPEVRIITDFKEENITGLIALKKAMGGNLDQIIPQVYNMEEYEAVQTMGYTDTIFTAYKITLDETKMSEFKKMKNLFALTVPKKWIDEHINALLPEDAPQILTHTINDPSVAEDLKAYGVSGFYTDYLIPVQLRK